MKRLVYASIKNMHGKVNESDYRTGYLYLLKHGVGPGALPTGVKVLKWQDLPNYWTAVWLDSVLTTDELKEYDIPSETELRSQLSSLGYGLNDHNEIIPIEACDGINASTKITAYDRVIDIDESGALSGQAMIDALSDMEIGTPLLLKTGGDYKQALYGGYAEAGRRGAGRSFYTGSLGATVLSDDFILNNPDRVSIILDQNDPGEVVDLEDRLAVNSCDGINASTKITANTSIGWQNYGDANPLERGRIIKNDGNGLYKMLYIEPVYDTDDDRNLLAAWLWFDFEDAADGWITDYLSRVADSMGSSVEDLMADPMYLFECCVDYFSLENFSPVYIGANGTEYYATEAEVEEALASIGY